MPILWEYCSHTAFFPCRWHQSWTAHSDHCMLHALQIHVVCRTAPSSYCTWTICDRVAGLDGWHRCLGSKQSSSTRLLGSRDSHDCHLSPTLHGTSHSAALMPNSLRKPKAAQRNACTPNTDQESKIASTMLQYKVMARSRARRTHESGQQLYNPLRSGCVSIDGTLCTMHWWISFSTLTLDAAI